MGTRLPAQNPAPVPAWKSDEGSPLFYAGIQMNLCGQMSQCCNFVHKHRILNGYGVGDGGGTSLNDLIGKILKAEA